MGNASKRLSQGAQARRLLHWLPLALLFTALAVVVSCDDACMELAKRICSCETSSSKRRQCEYRVDKDADAISPTSEELELCGELLDSCDCDKLGAGDLAACGLAP